MAKKLTHITHSVYVIDVIGGINYGLQQELAPVDLISVLEENVRTTGDDLEQPSTNVTIACTTSETLTKDQFLKLYPEQAERFAFAVDRYTAGNERLEKIEVKKARIAELQAELQEELEGAELGVSL